MVSSSKQSSVERLVEKLSKCSGFIITSYQGLKAHETIQLRMGLGSIKCDYEVVKNRLVNIAFDKVGIKDIKLVGPVGIMFAQDGLFAGIKYLFDFSNDHEKLKIVEGYISGRKVSLEELKYIASFASEKTVILKVVTMIKSPLVHLLQILQMPLQRLSFLLNKITQNNTS